MRLLELGEVQPLGYLDEDACSCRVGHECFLVIRDWAHVAIMILVIDGSQMFCSCFLGVPNTAIKIYMVCFFYIFFLDMIIGKYSSRYKINRLADLE